MKKTKDSGFYISKRIVQIFVGMCIIVGIPAGIALIICLPDLILLLRNCLSIFLPIPRLPISPNDTLTVDNYIIIILTILNCFITILLALIAYRLSKKVGEIQFDTQSTQRMLWATRVVTSISRNFEAIQKANLLKTVPKDLDVADIYDQDIIDLSATSLISKVERELLEECIRNFREISKSSEEDAKKKMETTIEKYFEVGLGLNLKKPLKDLLSKLEEIRWGGKQNV